VVRAKEAILAIRCKFIEVEVSPVKFLRGARQTEFRNARMFRRMLRAANLNLPRSVQVLLAQRAATFATYRHTGEYKSAELEKWLSKLAPNHSSVGIEQSETKAASTLHILSKAYSSGGHTKVVERWIDSASESSKHSVALTRGGFLPGKIVDAVALRGGRVYKLGKLTPLLKRAKQLSELASSYTHLVLHVHMDDVLPMLAFSKTSRFQNIVHFNHADHRFWVGASLPNRVIEMRTWGKALSNAKRELYNSEVVGIPMPSVTRSLKPTLDKSKARAALAIPEDYEVLLTIGPARKYARGPRTNFPIVMRNLLVGHPKRLLISVGQAKAQNSDWRELETAFPGQVRFVSTIARDLLETYISAADVGIDSFPMSGGTAVLDMFTLGLPVFSLKCETGHFDPVISSGFYCLTEQALVAKVNKSLNSSTESQQHQIQGLLDSCNFSFGRETWAGILNEPLAPQAQDLDYSNGLTESEIADLNGYLVASTPLVAKLFF